MFKAGFIDTWGRGFIKIREGFEGVGMPMPKVENFCGDVQVTVQRTKFMQMMNVGNNVTNNVTDVPDDVISNISGMSVFGFIVTSF